MDKKLILRYLLIKIQDLNLIINKILVIKNKYLKINPINYLIIFYKIN